MSAASLGDLALESGGTLLDFSQSFVTHGTLDAARANAVLVCSSLAGNHKRLDFLVGPGRALDPARYFIVATDAIGNGLTTSPSNSTRQPGAEFPRFTLGDMVSAQHRLLTEHLGIERLHAVAGASMGGMQALQWAVDRPDFARGIVAMTPMAKTAPWAALVVQAARACLMADPAWTGERFSRRPDRGWRAYAGLMNALLLRTPAAAIDADFEAFVAEVAAAGFDAHDFLYQSRAYEAFDVAARLGTVRARALVLAPPLDLFNPAESARAAAAAIPGATFVEIPSRLGHQAASSRSADDAAFLNRVIGEFLRGW